MIPGAAGGPGQPAFGPSARRCGGGWYRCPWHDAKVDDGTGRRKSCRRRISLLGGWQPWSAWNASVTSIVMGAGAVGDGALSWNQNPAGGPGGRASLLKIATKQQRALRAVPVAARKILS